MLKFLVPAIGRMVSGLPRKEGGSKGGDYGVKYGISLSCAAFLCKVPNFKKQSRKSGSIWYFCSRIVVVSGGLL